MKRLKTFLKNKKGVRVTAVALAAVLVLAGAGTGVWFLLRGGKPVNVYAVADIAQTDMWMDRAEYEGSVYAENLQAVYLSDTQQLKEIFVKEGDEVKKGDRLAAFDTTLSDLELDRQKIEVQKQELRLSAAKEELKTINSLTPYVPPTPAPEPEPEELKPVELPSLLRGDGSEEKPFVYLWNEDCLYDTAFIDSVLPLTEVLPAEEETAALPEEEAPAENEPAENEPESETPASPVYETATATVIFQVREFDNPDGALVTTWGMVFERQADGGYTFAVFVPEEEETVSEEPEPVEPEGGGYTAADIARMRSEKQEEIKNTEMQLKVERLRLRKLELELNTGIVTAELDGVVKSVLSEADAKSEGKPVVTVSADGAWQIGTYIGELEKEEIRVGDPVQITSWMDYMTVCEGVVTAVSDYPASGGWYGGNGNANVSYYPVTVEVDADEPLQNGDYVSVTFGTAGETSGFYVEAPFIRTEGSKSYVYVMDETQRLEKREIVTGRIYWGSTVEIVSGLTTDDCIAFPYGKNVKPGAKAKPADTSELYDGWYY